MKNKSLGCILESGLEGRRSVLGAGRCVTQAKLMNVCLGKSEKELGNYEIKVVFVLVRFFQFCFSDGAGLWQLSFTKCINI